MNPCQVYMDNVKNFKDMYYPFTPLGRMTYESFCVILERHVDCRDSLYGCALCSYQNTLMIVKCANKFLSIGETHIFEGFEHV